MVPDKATLNIQREREPHLLIQEALINELLAPVLLDEKGDHRGQGLLFCCQFRDLVREGVLQVPDDEG